MIKDTFRRLLLLRETTGKILTRFSFYLLVGIIALAVLLITNSVKPSTKESELVRSIAFTVLLSATILPIVKETIDIFFRKHSNELLDTLNQTELMEKYGIIHLAKNWKHLARPIEDGSIYKKLAAEYLDDSNWYIITINPKGLMENFFHETLIEALKHGSSVKWAYLKLPQNNNPEGQTLRDWWVSRYDSSMGDAETYENKLTVTRESLEHHTGILKNSMQMYFSKGTIKPEKFSLYENSLPTTYLAVLAIRGIQEGRENQAIEDLQSSKKPGLALVHPYQMWPLSDENISGMILGNSGELYYQYATSILKFFYSQNNTQYLNKIWPPES